MFASKLADAPLGLTYDDVLIIPQHSDVKSRRNVDTTTFVCGIPLEVPVISANMDTITGPKMAEAMWKAGGLGILHRYKDELSIVKYIKDLVQKNVPAVPSVGVKGNDKEISIDLAVRQAMLYVDAGAQAVCIDVAHADTPFTAGLVERLASQNVNVIVGNIATYDAGKRLVSAGAKALKVGIGPGAVCTTRSVTGHGYPQLSAVANVAGLKEDYAVDIIADGGIKNSGDVVKALAVGADAVMSGFLFAGCREAESHHTYRGMASKEARMSVGDVSGDYLQEGISVDIVPTGVAVKDILDKLCWGIKSGLSYSGAYNLESLRKRAKFVRVTTIGQRENATRL